jgi:hypothetical protein
MEVTSATIYLQQLLNALSDPLGMMVAVVMLTLCGLVIATNSARWYVLALALFAVSCAPPLSKWIVHVNFFFPLEFFRNWSRQITVGLLLMIATAMLRFDRGPRQKLLPASFWWFVAFQLLTSFRMMTSSMHFARGLWSICIIVLFIGICGLSLAPALHSMRDVHKLLWAVAAMCILAITSTLIQWRINPGSVQVGIRLYGITATPQGIGMLLAMAIPTMCYLLVRRKQKKALTFNLLIFGVFIPLGIMMVVWTGARGMAIATLAGLLGFFHRRVGRFVLAGAVCVGIGLLVAPYLSDAFQISDRFFSTENTRAQVWSQMFTAIGKNPWFGQLPDSANIYIGSTVGEGAFLMGLSIYGIIGMAPLAVCIMLMFKELLAVYRHRSLVPELTDLVDLLLGYWMTIFVIGVFESAMLSYLTLTPTLMYVMFTLQGYVVDMHRQAMVASQYGFPVVMEEQQMAYVDDYASIAY